ncbi:MAG: MarR family transcriptional regulator [Novosphingobium sp.]
MTERKIAVHIGSLEDMGRRFVEAWKDAEAGKEVEKDHVTFLGLDSFMAAMSPKRLELIRHLHRVGPRSVRRLSQELGRDYKSVHGEVARLADAGLIERTAAGEVAVEWDRIVTELDLAA